MKARRSEQNHRNLTRILERRRPWGEFNMQAPNVGGFVTVDGTATTEFDLFLKHG